MSRSLFTAFVAGILSIMVGPSKAGEVHIDVVPDLQPKSEIAVQGENLKLQRGANGAWHYEMSAQEIFKATLNISIPNPPPGYEAFNLTFDIPYFLDNATAEHLAAALVNDDVSDSGVSAFYLDIGVGPETVSDVILTHQRASRLWRERLRQLRVPLRLYPNQDDIKVAYWLLRTTRDLVVNQFLQVDDTSRGAAAWLAGTLSRERGSTRLFNTATVSAKDAKDLLDTLSSRESYVYSQIAQRLDDDLRMDTPSVCTRIEALDAFFSNLGPADRRNYDGQFGNSLRVKSALIRCKATSLATIKKDISNIPEEQRAGINVLIKSANSAVQDAQNTGTFPKLRNDVQSRVQELQSVLR